VPQTVYSYQDLAGNLTETIDALGQTTDYGYDGANRRTRVTEAVGTPLERTSWTNFDAGGQGIDVIGPLGGYRHSEDHGGGRGEGGGGEWEAGGAVGPWAGPDGADLL